MSPAQTEEERGEALRACIKKLAAVRDDLGTANSNIMVFARRELDRVNSLFPNLSAEMGKRAEEAFRTLRHYASISCCIEPSEAAVVRDAITTFLDELSKTPLAA